MAKKAYIGVVKKSDLRSIAEGESVLLYKNGSLTQFIVAKHDYEPELNGNGRTLLVEQRAIEYTNWNANMNIIPNHLLDGSTIDVLLNGSYKNKFSSAIQKAMATTTFRYTRAGEYGSTLTTMSRSVFSLSVTECGKSDPQANVEGTALPTAVVSKLESTSSDGTAYWTRSIGIGGGSRVFYMYNGKSPMLCGPTNAHNARPAFTLPSDIGVSKGIIDGSEASSTSVARKVKKGYLGIDGKARKIKKAYIGIGGVARPCWSSEGLEYYGTITKLTKTRLNLAGASVGDYALFGGGYRDDNVNTSASGAQPTVDAYNTSLTRSTPTSFPYGKYLHEAASVGDYALFAGGIYRNPEAKVYTYSKSLTQGTASNLQCGYTEHASAMIGDYALFAGGTPSNYQSRRSNVSAYNKSLTRSAPTALSEKKGGVGSATVGDYVIFAGGQTQQYNGYNANTTTVDAYNKSLTKSVATALGVPRWLLKGGTTGNHALFVGGHSKTHTFVDVDVYDASLTRIAMTNLTNGKVYHASASLNGLAIFAGGQTDATSNSTDDESIVISYDDSLTCTVQTPLSTGRHRFASCVVGNYVLFAGGRGAGSSGVSGLSDVVDVYTVA